MNAFFYPRLALSGMRRDRRIYAPYLAACVFYATLYGQSPEGLTGEPAKLDETTARALQRIAWTAVQ